MRTAIACVVGLFVVSCGNDPVVVDDGAEVVVPRFEAPPSGLVDDDGEDVVKPVPPNLEVHFLGVMGFVLKRGDDVVLTAPLFTRASEAAVSLGGDVFADEDAIDEGLADDDLAGVSAIVSGHAHYDHLLDVPHVMMNQSQRATLYANESAQHLLSAYAPDRSPLCEEPAPAQTLSRGRIVAADDPVVAAVDWRNCPDARPEGAPLEGRWLDVPGANVRIYPMCGEHPDQFLFYHFALGEVDEDQCEVPSAATRWKEGRTLTFLIDFLDDDGATAFRVYYQDAPSNGPIGHPPADVIADHDVDLALLCTGTWDQVRAQPEEIVAAVQPRFALSGHWEDFFDAEPLPFGGPRPIPLMDLDAYREHADGAMSGTPDVYMLEDGQRVPTRHKVAMPGRRFVIAPAPQP